jgi:hypothetical protein
MIWEDENEADISDHIDGRETEWKRMDDGSISKNPNSNNRKPQRQPAVQRWSPYGHKRKNTSEIGPCVSKEVVEVVVSSGTGEVEGEVLGIVSTEAKTEARVGAGTKVKAEVGAEVKTQGQVPEASEDGKSGSDQDMA